MITDKSNTFYICSEKVIKAFPKCQHSKPFKRGFENDDNNYYVAILDFDKVVQYYNKLPEEEQDGFYCIECVYCLLNGLLNN